MKKILFVLLAALLILSIFATGCGEPCVLGLAPIHDIDVWADESLPPEYFLHVVSGEPSGGHKFYRYHMNRYGDMIRVRIFNLWYDIPCPQVYSYVEHTIPLGHYFFPGKTYTVKVNNVTETFVA